MSKIIVDTNIFIYDLDKTSKYHNIAHDFLLSNDDLITTSKNISEFFAVTSKLNLEKSIILNYFNDIKNNITIIFPTNKSLKIFQDLIIEYYPIGNRVFDFEIISIMLSKNIDTLFTINQKDFSGIKKITLLPKLF